MSNENRNGGGLKLIAGAVTVALLGGAAGWFWQDWRGGGVAASVSGGDRAAVEKIVHDYILEHPEILPQAMENLQKQQNAKQLAGVQDDVETPFPGAILGNPQGKVTLVEFSDYACGYFRQSVADVEALLRANPDLRVVMRELPILSPASAEAARMALAAASQGKFAAFHRAMFAAGRPDPATIEAAARAAGLDLTRARADMASAKVTAEIERNMGIARELGFDGTPSFIIGDEIHAGAVGRERLAESIEKARG